MSLLSAEELGKIDALTELIKEARRGGPSVEVCELVAVNWPAPDCRVLYASTCADDVWPSLRAQIGDAPVEPRLHGGQFQEIMRESGIADDSVTLDFWDADAGGGEISALFERHAEGCRVEIYFYFPQVDLLLSMWHGHLRPPEDADEERFVTRAENGFMSVQLPLPRRIFGGTCAAMFGGLLTTQAEIDEHDCEYNAHLTEEERGGAPLRGNLDPATGLPYPSCPRDTRAACIARHGDDLNFLAFDTLVHTYAVGGKGAVATTRGNENNLKRPLRVIAGERTIRNLDLLASVVEIGNPAHAERGSLSLLYGVSEGRMNALWQPKIGQIYVGAQHWATRLGWPRQPALGFIAGAHNYPKTALLHVVLQGDYRNTDPASFATEIQGRGSDDVRHYTDETTYTEQYSRSRPWWTLHLYRHKRYGLGADVGRFAIAEDWIALDEWCAQTVSFRAKDGTVYTGPRSQFDADLGDRSAQQQINDICLAGRYTPPFAYQGKLRVFPYKKLTEEELSAAPVFTDYDSGYERNIVRVRDGEKEKSTLTRSMQSDRDLPNAVKVVFDDRDQNFEEHPYVADDQEQQLRAGRAFGDTGLRVVEKTYGLVGVTTLGEAVRTAHLLLNLGEFDEGGLQNKLRIKFTTFFTQALGLYKSKVIRVLSRQLINRKTGVQKFEYFRVRSVRQLPNLLCEVSAQAYPVEYYETTEDLVTPIGGGGILDDNPGGPRGKRPNPIVISDVDYTTDSILFRFDRSY
jgi:hypothetical protein